MDAHGGLFNPDVAAAVFSQSYSCSFNLSLSGLAAKLGYNLLNL
jgi:hypothetical protein